VAPNVKRKYSGINSVHQGSIEINEGTWSEQRTYSVHKQVSG